MHITDALLRNAAADRDLLRKNAERGDCDATPREVDFLLLAPSQEKAKIVASFVTDNSYGLTSVSWNETEQPDRAWGVLVKVVMPTSEHVLCSVSGLMECVAHLFGLQYDGWGSILRPSVQQSAPADPLLASPSAASG